MEEDENKWVRGEWGRAGRKTIHQTFRACPDKVIARLKKEKKKKKKKKKAEEEEDRDDPKCSEQETSGHRSHGPVRQNTSRRSHGPMRLATDFMVM